MPLRFRCEERLEDVAQDLWRYAMTRIGHSQHHAISPGWCAAITLRLDIGRRERQRTAAGHRIPGVGSEVHEHLLDLTRVDHNVLQRRVEVDHERDVLTDQTPEHALALLDQVAEVHHSRAGRPFAGKRQELARQPYGAAACLENLLQRMAYWRLWCAQPERLLRVTHDDADDVVEVMRDTAGKLADRLHLLCLRELLLQLPATTDV